MKENQVIYRLYLTEEGGAVRGGAGWVDPDHYKNNITIRDVRKTLLKYKLREEKEFEDWYAFSNDHLEISVPLKSEEDFYDDYEKTIQDLFIYVTLVSSIGLLIMKPLHQFDVDIITSLMEKFNLYLYDVESEKHYSTRDQIIPFLKEKQLLA